MKYWNKSRNTRQKHWTCVKLSIDKDRHPYFTGGYQGWTTWPEFTKIKVELQRSPSKSRFYMGIMKKEIWFENPKDATWVALKYSEILR